MDDSTGPKLCFGDLAELDHVIELLHELAEVIDHAEAGRLVENSPIPVLISRIDAQAKWQRDEGEISHPGAFDKSFLAQEYAETWHLLTELKYYPWELPAKLDRLVLRLHRVMILGNLTEGELCKTLDKLASAEKEAESLRRPASTGRKIIDGGNKGHRGNAVRDKSIFECFNKLAIGDPKLLKKILYAKVGNEFNIGAEAVKKAISRHKNNDAK